MAFPLVDGTTGETTDVHAGLVAKRVRCAATTAVTKATGVENGDTIDGVTLATGDRVALLAQASGAENGIWVVAASGAPTRALDFDESAEVLPGTLIVVSEGTANKDSIWQLTTNATITVDTTALVFFPVHLQGTGSPEGVVTAPIGATYRRTDGGAGTSFYIKESGTGNTGWAAPSTGSSGGPTVVRKTADESVTSSTAFQNDNELLFPILAGEIWAYEFILFVVGVSTTPDIVTDIVVPAGADGRWGITGLDPAATTVIEKVRIASATYGVGGLGAGLPTSISIVSLRGLVVNGGTGGNVQLQWAQSNSSADAATVKSHSFVIATKAA